MQKNLGFVQQSESLKSLWAFQIGNVERSHILGLENLENLSKHFCSLRIEIDQLVDEFYFFLITIDR